MHQERPQNTKKNSLPVSAILISKRTPTLETLKTISPQNISFTVFTFDYNFHNC